MKYIETMQTVCSCRHDNLDQSFRSNKRKWPASFNQKLPEFHH